MSRMPTTSIPKNWPKGVTFLTSLYIPASLPASKFQLTDPAGLHNIQPVPPMPSTLVKIAAITDPSHPANRQYGLFATRSLPPDSFILFYLGLVHDSVTADPESNYDLSFDRELGVSVDATRFGNEARFINDYRGIRTEANAEFRDCVVEVGKGVWERRIGVFVLSKGKNAKVSRAQGIKKGEEILVSYGKGFWNARKNDDFRDSLDVGDG